MQRLAVAPNSRAPSIGPWLARRWYYTPRTHRAYSVRQISPGDRRLLAEFASTLTPARRDARADEHGANLSEAARELTHLLFDRVLGAPPDAGVGFVALENTAAGDRVIGVSAYAATERGTADFTVAVANSFREEQVGRTLLSTLLRHARRVGVPRLEGEIVWSNRAMQMLALSLGFGVEPLQSDRNRR